MFLFEGSFGNILHTGDCRLTPECLQNLPEKYTGRKGKEPQCCFDYVFLDCTFGRFSQNLPSKHSAIRQVINCIWKHPNAPVVYLTCDLLGQEEILTSVSKTFGSKIYVDKANDPDYFQSLSIIAPEVVSEDPTSRFRVFDGFPKLSERATIMLAEAQANFQHEPLIIRPSAMWYVCEEERLETVSRRKIRFNEAIKDQFGIWHVCCSMHSSREELEWALKLLAPKRVVSTTPSCRAMELDYVRRHCFDSYINSDDSLWKLLDIDMEPCPQVNSPIKTVACSPMVEVSTLTCVESELQPINVSSCKKRLLIMDPPSKRPPVTLFEGSALQCKKLVTTETFEERLENKLDAVQTVMQSEEMRWDTYHEYRYESKQADETTMQCENLTRKEINKCSYSIGYPKGYSENFRKLYRSMNAPVPKPLPSLVELRNAIKRMMPGTITAQSSIPVIRASQVGANCVLDESGQELAEGEKFMICQCFSWCQQQRHHDQSSSDKICLANTVFVTHGSQSLIVELL
ncbi:hypothetical protein GOBAR_AA25125 [Gossypium barbadense]|uniref:DNA repair metallo-beta-lactamase domain-containing protein n=1 Tax=Gossypium barbadense TaxID=3634 RepID=A0A2P5WWS1_GOSBA|nr:hypothetical protein GOBAR_AA25125 [Gossypium barbadense]